MKSEIAEKRFGKRMWKKMEKYMEGITLTFDEDGDTDIPGRDIEYAYRMAKSNGKSSGGMEWD